MCGVVHRLHVHGYPIRGYRDRESGENKLIRVVSIRCPVAQAAGKPYTKRLLPEFLIPGCVIRLDYLHQAAELSSVGEDIEQVCGLLGCVDVRTAVVHLRRFEAAVVGVTAKMSEQRAMSPELGDLPEFAPDTSAVERLQRLVDAENRARVREGAGRQPAALHLLLQAMLGKQQRNVPSDYASPAARPP